MIGREKMRDLLNQLEKKYGVSVDFTEVSEEEKILFDMALPEELVSSYFLFLAAKKIAGQYGWLAARQSSSPEDDPGRISKWCEIGKSSPMAVTEKEVESMVKEASEIFKKVSKAVTKWKKQIEEDEKKIERQIEKDLKEFISDL